MPNSLEIFENTLLQLITRQGTDNDRKEVILKSGELGYTTDSKRLFIGDGVTNGGVATGNKFLGNTTNLLSLEAGLPGDIAYKTDESSIYTILSGDGKSSLNWNKVAGNVSPANTSISITSGNKISVLRLSAGMVSTDLLGSSMTLDTSNKITLTPNIEITSISTTNNGYLGMPRFMSIAGTEYSLPLGGLGNNKYLKTAADGQLSWSDLGSNVNYFAYNTGGIIPVGTVISTLTATNLNSDWVLCNGQPLPRINYQELFDVIGTSYGGDSTNFKVPNFTRDILYGTSSSPFNSTIIPLVSSSSNSVLSAAGVNFFIKAKPDKVIKGSLRVNSPLNMTINGQSRVNTNVPALTTLDSDVAISLPVTTIDVDGILGLTKNGTPIAGATDIFNGSLVISGPKNTLKVNKPLKITSAAVDRTDTAFSFYAGDLNLSLNTTNKISVESPTGNGNQKVLRLTANSVDKTSSSVNLDSQEGNIKITLDSKTLIDHLHPIGSILFSIDNKNPKERFTGTDWVQRASGKFIAGVGQAADSNGNRLTINSGGGNYGEYTHKLSISEMPAHNHIQTYSGGDRCDRFDCIGNAGTNLYPQAGSGQGGYRNGTTMNTAGDSSFHNNTPPGFGLYVWERIS